MKGNDFMTYEELKNKHILNNYDRFYCAEIVESYPYLLHFGTSKKYREYDDIAKCTFISLSFAKKNKISIYPHVVAFYHTRFGCSPLFAIICKHY